MNRLRTLLKRIRLQPLEGEGRRPIDDVDAHATAPVEALKGFDSGPGPTAPTNWVPSQQDWGKPRH